VVYKKTELLEHGIILKTGVLRNYSFLKFELIINGNKQEHIIIQELFEGPVGDYCIACNTIK